jgi:Ni,Fe-hydrogenase III small subunit
MSRIVILIYYPHKPADLRGYLHHAIVLLKVTGVVTDARWYRIWRVFRQVPDAARLLVAVTTCCRSSRNVNLS